MGGSRGAELGRAREGLGVPPRSPCLPTGCGELGLAWGPWAGPVLVGWGTGTVPSGTGWLLAGASCVPGAAVDPPSTGCPPAWVSAVPVPVPTASMGVRAMVDTVGRGLRVPAGGAALCPAQVSPGEPGPVSVGTSGPGVPSAEPWGSQVPPRGLSWPSASCLCQAMSGSSATAGAASPFHQAPVPAPATVVSVSRDAPVASLACSGGDQRTRLPPPQRSLPGTPAPLGSPDASQAGDGPGRCCPQAGLCRGSLSRCRVPPGDSPADSVPRAPAGTPVARSSPQVISRAVAMVRTQLALRGRGVP